MDTRTTATSTTFRRRRQGGWQLTALLCGWLAVLATTPAAALPDEDAAWLRVETAHFTLFSDADEAVVRQVGANLERLRAVLSQLGSGSELNSPLPTYLFVFADEASFAPYKLRRQGQPLDVAGFFLSRLAGNYVAINAGVGMDPSRVIYHEYLHYVINNNYPGVPLWFNEGLAEYYSTFEVAAEQVVLGQPVPEHVLWLRQHRLLPLDQLLALDGRSADYHEGELRGGFYAQSWALVHYLLSSSPQRRQQTLTYLDLLNRDVPQDEAFREAFEADYPALERELRQAIIGRRFPTVTLPVPQLPVTQLAGAPPVRVTPLERVELLYRLGDLLAQLDDGTEDGTHREAAEHFREALRLDPRHGPSYAGLGALKDAQGSYEEAWALYERALELAPNSFLIQYLYGRSLLLPWSGRSFRLRELDGTAREHLAQARRSFNRSIELNPGFGEAYAGLGASYVFEEEPPESAAGYLEAARRLLPSRRDVAFNLAVLYARLGHQDRARQLIERELKRPDVDPALARDAQEAVLQADLRQAQGWLAAGRKAEALEVFERVAAATENPELRAGIDLYLSQVREAEASSQAAARHNRFVRRYKEALQRILAQDYESARALLQELAASDAEPELLAVVREQLAHLDQLTAVAPQQRP